MSEQKPKSISVTMDHHLAVKTMLEMKLEKERAKSLALKKVLEAIKSAATQGDETMCELECHGLAEEALKAFDEGGE